LPGTAQRRQDELVGALERALADYDYITSARVTAACSLKEGDTAPPIRLAVQLRFSPTVPPPNDWLNALVSFVHHTVPDMSRQDLLVTDTGGQVLFAQGAALRCAVR
jgi:hypothetical protein